MPEMETQVEEMETPTEMEPGQEELEPAEETSQEEPTAPTPEPTAPKEGKTYTQAEVSKIQSQYDRRLAENEKRVRQLAEATEQAKLESVAAEYIRQAEERGEGDQARQEVKLGVAELKQRQAMAQIQQQSEALAKEQIISILCKKAEITPDEKEIAYLRGATSPEHLEDRVELLKSRTAKAKTAIANRKPQKIDSGVGGGRGGLSDEEYLEKYGQGKVHDTAKAKAIMDKLLQGG